MLRNHEAETLDHDGPKLNADRETETLDHDGPKSEADRESETSDHGGPKLEADGETGTSDHNGPKLKAWKKQAWIIRKSRLAQELKTELQIRSSCRKQAAAFF